MLSRRDVSIGKCYVQEKAQLLREVIAVTQRQKVVYDVYDLQTGKLLRKPHQTCQWNQMIRWADREANIDEYTKLERNEAATLFESEQFATLMNDAAREAAKARSFTEAQYLTPPR